MEFPLSLDRICRTCLCETSSSITVFSKDSQQNCKIFTMIIACSTMKIVVNDGLPDRICSKCINSVRNAFAFKQQCDIAYQTLQSFSHQLSSSIVPSAETDNVQTSLSAERCEEKNIILGVECLPKLMVHDSDKCETDPDEIDIDCKEEIFENVEFLSENEVMKQEKDYIDSIETESYVDALGKSNIHKKYCNHTTKAVKKMPTSKQCEYCDKVFGRSTHLRRHLLTHTKEKHFKCKICTKAFSRSDHLAIHESTFHSQERPFACELCEKAFKRMEHLRTHVDSKHGDSANNKKQEFCNVCNKGFASARYLDIHKKIHNEQRVFKCKYCDKGFPDKLEQRQHIKLEHHKGTMFLCSECGQSFMRNDYLLVHMRRHSGIKPYKCKFCPKAFPRATDLRVHEKYHTNDKPHLCTICGKGFHRAYNLLVHSRTHNGSKPYRCPHCQKSFAQGNDLKAHVRRHTGERYKCEICNEGFIQCYQLNNHKRSVHNIDIATSVRRVTKYITPSAQEQQVLLQNQHERLKQLITQQSKLKEQLQYKWKNGHVDYDSSIEKQILETKERISDVERELDGVTSRLNSELECRRYEGEQDNHLRELYKDNDAYNPNVISCQLIQSS